MGSRFCFELVRTGRGDEGWLESRLDLMLVDDEEADVELFGRAVRKTGLNIRVHHLSTGQQAIDYLEAKGPYAQRAVFPLPDVIVLDLKMPGLNGFDFLAWRKVSTLFVAIPVVVFSGSCDPREIRRVMELGAKKHIPKPATEWEAVIRDIYDLATEGTAFFRARAPGVSTP